MGKEPSTNSPSVEEHAPAAGWRDVATRYARETLAERICARFFTRSVQAAAASPTETQPADLVTAGQRLQTLSGDADTANVGPQNLAAILDASARNSVTAVSDHDAGKARAEASLTAKAA